MLAFLSENLATILISALVLLAAALAILKIRRDKKKSPCGSCCSGCSGCPRSEDCGRAKK